jgi:hypothetical protein
MAEMAFADGGTPEPHVILARSPGRAGDSDIRNRYNQEVRAYRRDADEEEE